MVKWSNYPLVFLVFILFSCYERSDDKAQAIIDKAIEKHGGALYENFRAEFDFRNKHYVISRDKGAFEYQRIFEDSTGEVKDVLDNSGFSRYVDNNRKALTEEWRKKYSNSVNSVAYFAMLPFGLNDPAVIKEYIGDTEINDKQYHKIKVTFGKEGGGKDHEDEFVYWINQDDYSMDYLAYLYYSDGGGRRFREAFNQREVNGIIFSDYKNYSFEDDFRDISSFDSLFEKSRLIKVSEIILKNVDVNTN